MRLYRRSIAAVASDVLFVGSVAVGSVALLLEEASQVLRRVALR